MPVPLAGSSNKTSIDPGASLNMSTTEPLGVRPPLNMPLKVLLLDSADLSGGALNSIDPAITQMGKVGVFRGDNAPGRTDAFFTQHLLPDLDTSVGVEHALLKAILLARYKETHDIDFDGQEGDRADTETDQGVFFLVLHVARVDARVQLLFTLGYNSLVVTSANDILLLVGTLFQFVQIDVVECEGKTTDTHKQTDGGESHTLHGIRTLCFKLAAGSEFVQRVDRTSFHIVTVDSLVLRVCAKGDWRRGGWSMHLDLAESSRIADRQGEAIVLLDMVVIFFTRATSPASMSSAKTKAQNIIDQNGVAVFSKSYCPYCKATKELLSKSGAKFYALELDQIDDGADIQNALAEMTSQRSVPNIFINKEHIGGNSDIQALKKDDLKSKLTAANAFANTCMRYLVKLKCTKIRADEMLTTTRPTDVGQRAAAECVNWRPAHAR
ncbi:hypothetical protein KCU61_g284, partial [Aureobasidium melanogenum]